MVISPRRPFTWRLRSRTIALGERTLVMAILNVTPDSFSDDGLLAGLPGAPPTYAAELRPGLSAHTAGKLAIAAAVEALHLGADILDIGAESTRPGAEPLTSAEEQQRLLPVLEGILHARPDAIVSVDTYHASTARIAARIGAEIINDVSGLLWDEEMADTAAATGCGVVLMHTRGRPLDWSQQPPLHPKDVVPVVFEGLCESLLRAEAAKIASARTVLDPGFGFGKRGRENLALLAGLERLNELGRPLLVGLSRKGFLGEAVRPTQPRALPVADARRTATIAANTTSILAGAHILRVHEVQPAREAAAFADALLRERHEA
jgi:dihydropteroate synthase